MNRQHSLGLSQQVQGDELFEDDLVDYGSQEDPSRPLSATQQYSQQTTHSSQPHLDPIIPREERRQRRREWKQHEQVTTMTSSQFDGGSDEETIDAGVADNSFASLHALLQDDESQDDNKISTPSVATVAVQKTPIAPQSPENNPGIDEPGFCAAASPPDFPMHHDDDEEEEERVTLERQQKQKRQSEGDGQKKRKIQDRARRARSLPPSTPDFEAPPPPPREKKKQRRNRSGEKRSPPVLSPRMNAAQEDHTNIVGSR